MYWVHIPNMKIDYFASVLKEYIKTESIFKVITKQTFLRVCLVLSYVLGMKNT